MGTSCWSCSPVTTRICGRFTWPLHVVAYAVAVVAVALVLARRRRTADRVIAGVMACLWVWLGIVFQGMYVTDVDPVLGTAYAVMFILQGYLFWRHGVVRRELFLPGARRDRRSCRLDDPGVRRCRLSDRRRRSRSRLAGVPSSGHGPVSHHDRNVRSPSPRCATRSTPAARGPVRLGSPGPPCCDGEGCLRGCWLVDRRCCHRRAGPASRSPPSGRGIPTGGNAVGRDKPLARDETRVSQG